MRKRISMIVLAALLAAAGRATAAGDDPFDRRNGVSLQGVSVEEALTNIGGMTGLPVDLNGFTGDPVFLELWNVRVRTLLDVVCESLGCRWELADGTIRITAVPGAQPAPRPKPSLEALDTKIDVKVTGADALALLRSTGEVLSVRPTIDPAVEGEVTLDAEDMEVRKVLDAICASVGCEWSLDVEKGLLIVRPKAQK